MPHEWVGLRERWEEEGGSEAKKRRVWGRGQNETRRAKQFGVGGIGGGWGSETSRGRRSNPRAALEAAVATSPKQRQALTKTNQTRQPQRPQLLLRRPPPPPLPGAGRRKSTPNWRRTRRRPPACSVTAFASSAFPTALARPADPRPCTTRPT